MAPLLSLKDGLRSVGEPGGAFPNKVPATLEIRPCSVTSAPLQGRLIYSNSRVHGNRTLYAEAGSYHYKLLLLNCMVPGFLPRREVEEGNSEALLLLIITTYTIQCCSNFCFIVTLLLYMNCWLILFSCCNTRQKMLVFDRPNFLPLF